MKMHISCSTHEPLSLRMCRFVARFWPDFIVFISSKKKKSISGVFTDIANARSHRTILLFQQFQCL